MLHTQPKLNVDAIRATLCQHRSYVPIKVLGYGACRGGTYEIIKCKCAHCKHTFTKRKERACE